MLNWIVTTQYDVLQNGPNNFKQIKTFENVPFGFGEFGELILCVIGTNKFRQHAEASTDKFWLETGAQFIATWGASCDKRQIIQYLLTI